MKKQRKHYTPEEKVAILRRHLVEGVPISDLCDELGFQPTVFYRWQKEFFENGAAAFLKEGNSLGLEVLMNPGPRLATLSLLLLFTFCSLSWLLQANNERTTGPPFAESVARNSSAGLQQAAQPDQAADSQSPASEIGPLFPVVEHGKWGYIDKSGKIVIPLQYYFASGFSEGLAFVDGIGALDSRARWVLRVAPIDKTGKMIGSKVYGDFGPLTEGLARVAVSGERGYGFIDKTGKTVILQEYAFASDFFEGLVVVGVG